MIVWLLFLLIASSYLIFVLFLILGWKQKATLQVHKKTTFSIVIPFRNEAENLERLLNGFQNQKYPFNLFEILLVDDHSEDESWLELGELLSVFPDLKIIPLQLPPSKLGKKEALQMGINHSNFEVILTLDADVSVPHDLLFSYNFRFENNSTQLVAGSVIMESQPGFLNDFQQLEFLSLIGAGGSLIQIGLPVMCNGANLAFRKTAFDAVGGYFGHDKIASGDDVFLLHAITKYFKSESVQFLQTPPVTVVPASTWRQFFEQRQRWAGKAVHYSSLPAISTSIIVFLASLALVLSLPLVFFHVLSVKTWVLLWMMKVIPDYLFLKKVAKTYRIKIKNYWLSAILYPFYISVTAIFSWVLTAKWKGRSI